MKCCNKNLTLQKGKSNNEDMVYYKCPDCGKKGMGKNQKEAEQEFCKSKAEEKTPPAQNIIPDKIITVVQNKNDLDVYVKQNLDLLVSESAQFQNKPATQRMIFKNASYVMNKKHLEKLWKDKDGIKSLMIAMGEANYYAATLGEMGSILPFGNEAVFVAGKECYDFALTTGKNAPLSDIRIEAIHSNDIVSNSQKDDNFVFSFESFGIPRGDIIAVSCSATLVSNGKRIGKIYDTDRLLGKAFEHSQSYKTYMLEKENFKTMRVEGKLKTDDFNREYYVKKIPKRDGSTWDKQIFEHDITTPYIGANQVEMLEKMAAKSFLRQFMKVRNAMAMAEEWTEEAQEEHTLEQTASNVLDKAMDQFKDEKIVDAEIVKEELFNEQTNF